LAFLEQHQGAVIVLEAASTQRANPAGCGAVLGNDGSLAAQLAHLGKLVGGEQGQRLIASR
jgi:hypothetical protein